MKKTLLLIILTSFMIFCCRKKQINTEEVTLVFNNSIVLPASFYDLTNQEKAYYKQTLNDHKTVLPVPLDSEIRNFERINLRNKIFELKANLKSLIGKTLSIRPVFNLKDTRIYYFKVEDYKTRSSQNCVNFVSAKGKSMTANLNNVALLGCLTANDCESVKRFLNNLGLGTICTVICTSTNSGNRGITTSHDHTIQSVCNDSRLIDFRSILKINDLHALTFDSSGRKFNFMGRNANLILVETAGRIDNTHFKFANMPPDTWRKEEILGYGKEKNHATWTFGVLFANNDMRINNCTKGIATEARVRKIIYHSGAKCNTEAFSTNGALLRAMISSKNGDILLLEEMINNRPLEANLIAANLIAACTNILGVTVIEPIGEKIGGIDFDRQRQFIPPAFEGILVSSAIKNGNNYDKSSNSNSSTTHIDSFGLDNIQTTSANGSFALYGLTSAAAAQIAGLALDIQGYYYTKNGCYLTPQQMKNLFRKTASPLKVRGFQQVIPDAIQLKLAIDKFIRSPNIPL